MRRRNGTLRLSPSSTETEGQKLRRNLMVTVHCRRVDEVWKEVRESRPDLSREEVLDALVADWDVRRQLHLINTQPADVLADRVLMILKGG